MVYSFNSKKWPRQRRKDNHSEEIQWGRHSYYFTYFGFQYQNTRTQRVSNNVNACRDVAMLNCIAI